MKNVAIRMLLLVTATQLLLSGSARAGESDETDITRATETTSDKQHSADIRRFIRAYAHQVSKDIVVDPRVRGDIRLMSVQTPGKITKDEFHMVLLTHGYGSYEEGDLIVVAQQVLNKQRNIPDYDGKSRGGLSPHQTVTTLIKVKQRDAEPLVAFLGPLVEQWGYINVDHATNTLIAVTTLSNAERLHRLVKKLDRKPVE